MIFKLEHYPVNWIDGMKISKQHFIESNDYISDLVRDSNSIQLTSLNFGLLPAPKNGSRNFEITVETKNDSIMVITLYCCYAITQGGFRISYDPLVKNELSIIRNIDILELNNNTFESFYIILFANPFVRTPIGIPSIDENPPRHPYSDVTYELQIIPTNQINNIELGPYCLIIGKIQNEYGLLKLDKKFIPACTQLLCHEDLIHFHKNCLLKLENLKVLSLNIIKKINDKNKPSTIANTVFHLCKIMALYISKVIFKLQHELLEKTPIKTIEIISSMAQNQYCFEKCLSEIDREEYLKYIMEWTELTPKDLEYTFSSICEIKYDHNNIYESVVIASNYLKKNEAIWNALCSLEFIGQHKENMVVTKETIQLKDELPKKRWSILD